MDVNLVSNHEHLRSEPMRAEDFIADRTKTVDANADYDFLKMINSFCDEDYKAVWNQHLLDMWEERFLQDKGEEWGQRCLVLYYEPGDYIEAARRAENAARI